ncbi:MAG: hypothetical protein LBR32_04800 [Propionibacteriaceae bacterium]|nr:hypothetical protein [Propionibacteriaceae bacterium]
MTFHALAATADLRRDELLKEANSGEFTVIAVDSQWVPELASLGMLDGLDQGEFDFADYLPQAAEPLVEDGVAYAVPLASDVGVLVSTLPGRSSGTTALRPECAVYSSPTPCYGAAYARGDGLTVAVMEAVQAQGGELFAADQTVGDKDALLLALEQLAGDFADFQTGGGTPPEAAYWDDADVVRALDADRLKEGRVWASQARGLAGAGAVSELPGLGQASVGVYGGLAVAVNAHGRNLATARDFAKWLADPQRQRQRYDDAGMLPVTASLLAGEAGAGGQWGQVAAKAVTTAVARPPVADYHALSQVVYEAVWPVLAQGREPQAAVDEIESGLAQVVAAR